MCGIAGFNWADKKLIEKMTSVIAHRGPDDYGIFNDKKVSLGHRRLSIIDLSKKGKQPMFSEKKDVAIVFNGEIWNFKKLKNELEKKHRFASNTDTEVIVHGYEEYGEEIIKMLEGMFALAIYDKEKNKILLARDRVGKKPLYYYFDKKKFIFASEIKAILESGVKREIDTQALSDYLTLRHPSRNDTMFRNIKRLNPGSYAVFENNKLDIKRYWGFPKFTNKNKASVGKLDYLIENAVKKRLMSDVPIGIFLSGGLDSSALVAYLSKFSDKVKTFSIGFGDASDETKYAKIIADKFKTEHKEIISSKEILKFLPEVIYHMDEPLADPASAPTYLLSKEVSKYVKVIIAGDGGDEVFGGYQAFNLIDSLNKIFLVPRFARKIISPFVRYLSRFYFYPKKQMLMLGSEILRARNRKEAYTILEYFPFGIGDKKRLMKDKTLHFPTAFHEIVRRNRNLKDAASEYYFKEWIPNDLLLKADKMSMAHGLELRTPFLDIYLVEYSAGLNNKYKKNRRLFREVVSAFLPEIIMKKKKQGFTLPISNWFGNKDFYRRIKIHLDDLRKRGFFDEKEFDRIVNNPTYFKNDHKLWVLLNLEIWCKIFLDEKDWKKIRI